MSYWSDEWWQGEKKYGGGGGGVNKMWHYGDVIMGAIASQITSLTIVYSTVYSDAGQRKYQSSASLTFVWGIHRGPVNSPHKWPVTRKMFPFDDVIMNEAETDNVLKPVWWPDLVPADIFTLNPLDPGRCSCNLKLVIFKIISMISTFYISRKLPQLNVKRPHWSLVGSTLVQVMALCRQATNHSLSQCWPRYLSP